MNSKGQMVGQIFIYILAIVVAGAILLYGYNAIRTISGQAEDVAFVKFKTTIERDFQDIASSYGTVRIKTYEPGTKYDEVCFVDDELIRTNAGKDIDVTYYAILESHPILKDALETGTKNDLFLEPGEQQIDLGTVKIPETEYTLLCMEVKNGKFTVKIKGTGRAAEISTAK